jgi:hypothetical protein
VNLAAHVKDAVTSTVVMSSTTSCIELMMNFMMEHTPHFKIITQIGMETFTVGGYQQHLIFNEANDKRYFEV